MQIFESLCQMFVIHVYICYHYLFWLWSEIKAYIVTTNKKIVSDPHVHCSNNFISAFYNFIKTELSRHIEYRAFSDFVNVILDDKNVRIFIGTLA